jgi:23S rRNA (cytidine1920-2'-O)/16S rRNA (cytidine1409-2'-O)-methyltransferase
MPYVSRAGEKLAHALTTFPFNPAGLRAADFGCNIGGFTDCLLQHKAAHVFALDTGYGTLAWTLRNDPRVTVMERTNALHAPPPTPDQDGKVDLITIDLAWTPQRLALPAALTWLKDQHASRIITLVKPHYEAKGVGEELPPKAILDDATAERVLQRVIAHIESDPTLNLKVEAQTKSPLTGGKQSKTGNPEYLLLLARRSDALRATNSPHSTT